MAGKQLRWNQSWTCIPTNKWCWTSFKCLLFICMSSYFCELSSYLFQTEFLSFFLTSIRKGLLVFKYASKVSFGLLFFYILYFIYFLYSAWLRCFMFSSFSRWNITILITDSYFHSVTRPGCLEFPMYLGLSQIYAPPASTSRVL